VIDLREIRSVTEFQRNIKDYIGRLKQKKTPLVLTVNGRAELVVQNADSYQLLLERLERAEASAAERLGPAEDDPLDQSESQRRISYGFSRPRRLKIWR
jgi:PHD/YefM family antitoxin component YafN of YafNO toxin-antitoxin module